MEADNLVCVQCVHSVWILALPVTRWSFCFKYNSSFLFLGWLCLKKEGLLYTGIGRFFKSCLLKLLIALIFLQFYGIHPFPLIHLSISKFHCCCIKFLTEHEVLSHTLEVPDSVFIMNSMLESHFSLPQGSSFLPVCQNKQMLLVLVLSAWSPAHSSNSSLCCFLHHNKLLLCLFSEGTL